MHRQSLVKIPPMKNTSSNIYSNYQLLAVVLLSDWAKVLEPLSPYISMNVVRAGTLSIKTRDDWNLLHIPRPCFITPHAW